MHPHLTRVEKAELNEKRTSVTYAITAAKMDLMVMLLTVRDSSFRQDVVSLLTVLKLSSSSSALGALSATSLEGEP